MRELYLRHKSSSGPIVISFFFRHGVRKLESARRVIPTLSYQLLEKFPQLAHYYEGLIRRHPRIFVKASDDQFQKLILDPLDQITSQAVRTEQEVVIILDGIDECKDKDKDEFLLFLLPKIASLDLRVRIIISSRRSPRVTEEVLQSYGVQMVESVNVDGDMAIRSVKVFLEQNFERIWKKKKTLLKGTPLPDDQQVKFFAKYSRGQFAYATALTKYTERNGTVPTQVLPMLCDPVRAVGAFGELDHLYTTVLIASTKSFPRDDVRSILATIVAASHPQNTAQIAALSGVAEATVYEVVEALPGLLHEATEDGPIEILYPSFADYLCNQKRAHSEYWVDEAETHKRLVNRGLASLLPTLTAPSPSISSSHSSQIRQYASVSVTMRHCFRKATQAFGKEWFHQEASSLIGIHTSSNKVAMDRLPMLFAFHSMIPPHSPTRHLVDSLCLRFVWSDAEARGIIRSILGGVLVFAEAQSLPVLAEIFNLKLDKAEEVFRNIPFFQGRKKHEGPLKFAHPELEEFLTDKDQSFGVGLYLSAPEQHFQIVKRAWERLLLTAQFVAKQQGDSATPPSISRAAITYLVSHLGHHAQSLENAARLRHLVGMTLGALGDVFKGPLSPNRLRPLLELVPIFQPLAQNLAPSDHTKLRKAFTILAPILLSSLDLTHTMRGIIGIVLVAQEPPSLADLEEGAGVQLDDGLLDRIQPLLRSEATLGEGEPRVHIVNQWIRESLLDKKRCKEVAFDKAKHHGDLVRQGVEAMSSLIQIRLRAADKTKWPQDSKEPLKANPSLFHILKDEEKRLVCPHPRLRHHYRFASAESLKDIEKLLKKLGRVLDAYRNAKVFPVSVFLLVLALIDFLKDRDDTPDPSEPVHPTPPSLQKTILDIQDLLHSVLRKSSVCDSSQAQEEIIRVLMRLSRDVSLLTRQGHTERHLSMAILGLEEIVSKKNK